MWRGLGEAVAREGVRAPASCAAAARASRLSRGGEARIVVGDLLLKKHLHAAPLGGRAVAGGDATMEIGDELADAGTFQRSGDADGRAVAEERRKDAGGTERSDDLVVPLVDDEEVGLELGAVGGDGADDVRVDRGDRGVDDLESGA